MPAAQTIPNTLIDIGIEIRGEMCQAFRHGTIRKLSSRRIRSARPPTRMQSKSDSGQFRRFLFCVDNNLINGHPMDMDMDAHRHAPATHGSKDLVEEWPTGLPST